MAERDPAIFEIIQPYTSFNGKPREQGIDFYIRVSERLKHKNRALTLDDYEKLILAQFPQIYKVKCVPQSECARAGVELLAPEARGEIVVIVILKNSNSTPFFPSKPKTPANLLEEIQRYIRPYMPPLVKVTVRNPRFEEIKYRLAVKFSEGYDRGYYINILNEDIKRFLSPWAYDKEAEVSFGASVYSSSVINFIENRDYVDYVANFGLLQQIIQHENSVEIIPLFLTEDNAATVKYPDSILVSADNHIIDVITTEFFNPGDFNGIGHMQIGTDFWISRPGPVFAVGIGDMEIEAWPVFRYAFAGLPEVYFTNTQSEQIWNSLKTAGYIENDGNVSPEKDLNADYHEIMITAVQTFEDYVWETFGLENGEKMNDAVVKVLQDGLNEPATISVDAFANSFMAISREGSEDIWETLKISGYLDPKGNVAPMANLDDEDLPVLVGKRFSDYLHDSFGVENGDEIQTAVVSVLRASLEQKTPLLPNAFVDISGTGFSEENSRQIWNSLKIAGYLDIKGNVLRKNELEVENPELTVLVSKSFETYLASTFRYLNTYEIKAAVVDILKAGLGFSGLSQYPFYVY
jgi:hypothetical protein